MITDREGRIEYVNRAFEETTGYPRGEVLGRTPGFLASGRHQRKLYEHLWKTILAGRTYRGTLINRTKGGKLYQAEKTITPIRDPWGRITHFVSIESDVTERQRAEEALKRSEERYRLISQLTSDYAFSYRIGRNGKMYAEWITDSFTRITGYSVKEILRRPDSWKSYVHPEDIPRVAEKIAASRSGQPVVYEFRIITKPGGIRHLRSYVRPLTDERGRSVRVFGATQDITERKQAREDVVRARECARAAARARAQIFATMAHELRTPIAEAMVHLDAILGRQYGRLTRKQEEALAATNKIVDELREIIDTSLDAMRLDAGQVSARFRSVNLCDLVEEVADEARALCDESGLHFECHVEKRGCQVTTDPVKLKVILRNLLRNAVKYTKRGRVTLVAQPLENGVEFSVADTGCGIPAAALPRIFDPFWRSRTQAPKHGMGLGLYIAKRFVEMLSGTMSVESEPQKGSVFRFRVPAGG
jgi:PAS domain S-box-containing protein